jgi:hypothetical protein
VTHPSNPTYEVEVWCLAVVRQRIRVLSGSARCAVEVAENDGAHTSKGWEPIGFVGEPVSVDVKRIPAKPNGQRDDSHGEAAR